MGTLLFFLFAFATIAALMWCALQLTKEQEDPLGDRLEMIQNANMVAGTGKPKRKKGKGIMGVIGSVPGAEDWIKENEKRLKQAGAKSPTAIVYYTVFNAIFLTVLLGGMAFIQRNNNFAQMVGGMVAAFLMGYMLPKFRASKVCETVQSEASGGTAGYHRSARHRAWHRSRPRSSHASRK